MLDLEMKNEIWINARRMIQKNWDCKNQINMQGS